MTPPAAVRARVVPPLAIHQDGASVRIDVMHYDTARARASSPDGHSAKVRLYTKLESKTYTVKCRRGAWTSSNALRIQDARTVGYRVSRSSRLVKLYG